MQIVYVNGEFVPEVDAKVSVFDRAFLYGDGLFETIRIRHGRAHRWDQHLNRLKRGADFLKIPVSNSDSELAEACLELVRRNGQHEGVVRITLSRGVGVRGYSPREAERPQWVMSLHPVIGIEQDTPAQWRLITSSIRLAVRDPLAGLKTCNKLHQVVARSEADSFGVEEALLLNTDEQLAEGASSNLFWIDGQGVWTPPLSSGALAGVTRAAVLEICEAMELKAGERRGARADLMRADGVFLTLSSLGIVEAMALDGTALSRSRLVQDLHQAYQALMERETNG